MHVSHYRTLRGLTRYEQQSERGLSLPRIASACLGDFFPIPFNQPLRWNSKYNNSPVVSENRCRRPDETLCISRSGHEDTKIWHRISPPCVQVRLLRSVRDRRSLQRRRSSNASPHLISSATLRSPRYRPQTILHPIDTTVKRSPLTNDSGISHAVSPWRCRHKPVHLLRARE